MVRQARLKRPQHIITLKRNLKEINRLLEIHKEISGSGPGYKHNVQVLNKSAIVLLLACWEAYIEDLAKYSFKFMLDRCNDPNVFPDHVLANAAKMIKQNEDIWKLANSGWKNILESYNKLILNKYIERGAFNTPSPKNIDYLFSNLIGLTSLSRKWYWKGMSINQSKRKLENLIELRGNIAHRVQSPTSVTKAIVLEYKEFILRLSVISNNRLVSYIKDRVGEKPWQTFRYRKTK